MNWLLYILVIILFIGGLVLVFARDWVWSIDSRSEAHERDENGKPIRTEKWDKAHQLQGVVMMVVAVVLGIVVYLFL